MSPNAKADRNVKAFIFFRILFNARFYYPVIAVLFLDLGLSLQQYSWLNVAWAASIVFLEVPSGALADIWGRKKLIILAGFLMVVEMLVFSFTPTSNIQFMFYLFLVNRALSGAAEAAASGADEALAFDALKSAGREKEWPLVLQRLGRWKSVAFFVAMIVGAAVYDPSTFNTLGSWLGMNWTFTSQELVRMPIFLTLVLSFFALASSFFMCETPIASEDKVGIWKATKQILSTCKWIYTTPIAFFVILATLSNDGVIRLFMTMNSQYFRLLGLPELSFGLIGAFMALLGFIGPSISLKLIKCGSPRKSFGILSIFTLLFLIGISQTTSIFGLFFCFGLGICMNIVMFLASHYLNEISSPKQRATVLSFKGLTANLSYGGLGILFAAALKYENNQFMEAVSYLPATFLIMIGAVYLLRSLISTK